MRPALLIPVTIFALLCLAGAWIEYSQHSGLMLEAASGDVAQLCAGLKAANTCPKSLKLTWRETKDPWAQPYRCRSTPRGLLIYTLGADDEVGGTQRDADILCTTSNIRSDGERDQPCACAAGEEASKLLE